MSLITDIDRDYWTLRLQLAVKSALAAVLAWLVAKHVLGQDNPYFAPLAALFGVYPTIVTSLSEGLRYAVGFLVGALLAIPIGIGLGPTAGIAVTIMVGILVSGWRRLGDQGSQVSFTALFAVLLGGDDVVSYVLPRLADVGVGVAIGLAVNVLVFPPLHMRRAANAIGRLQGDVADSLDELASIITVPELDGDEWDKWNDQADRLDRSERTARELCGQAHESRRGNPRALWNDGPARDSHHLRALEDQAGRIRFIADVARQATGDRADGIRLGSQFLHRYAQLLRALAELVRQVPETDALGAAETATLLQRRLESPHLRAGTDPPGLWDPEKELLQLSATIRRRLPDPYGDG